MKVICISGKAQHGKDTTAAFLEQCLKDRGDKVLVTHYADLLKYICKSYFGWDGVKDERGRQILQYVGTDVIRKKEPDYWVDFVCSVLKMFDGEWDWVIIPDTRFPNEVEIMKNNFDTMHLRVIRPFYESPLTAEQQNHPSEIALDDYIPDWYIENTGSEEDLKVTINTLFKEAIYAD